MTTEKPMYLVTANGVLLGVCSHSIAGWRFIPHTTSRKISRKAWSSATKCIPAWAFNMSEDLLTCAEWKSRQAAKPTPATA